MEKDHYDDGNLVDLHPGVEDPSAAYHADYQHETATPVVEGKYQDVKWGIAFLAHLLVTGIIFVVTLSRSNLPVYEGLVPSSSADFVPLMLKAFALAAFFSAILGYAALFVMKVAPTFCIHAAMIANMVLLTGVVIAMFVRVAWWAGLLFLVFPLLWLFIYWAMWPFIPFLSELLSAVSTLVMKYPSTLGLNVVSVVLQFGWILLFSYLTLAIQARFGRGGVTALTIYLLLSFYWTMQMLQNIVHTANCGVFATWYFMNNTNAMPSSPMLGSLKRTLTTSFGSVALGSLIVAIIQTLRTLASMSRNRASSEGGVANLVLCIIMTAASCILSVLESIARYINHYAFVIIATYGQSYFQAGKTTWEMFERTGFINLLNDNMLSRLRFAVCTLISTIITLASIGFTYWMGLSGAYVGVVCGSCFFSSFLVSSLIMQTVESAAATIYVCFAEDSAALARVNPNLYERIRSTFGGEIVAGGVV